jgi:pimeloyl-ACP methyl ester carboxylesterase
MAMLQNQELLIPSAFGRDMSADLTYTVGSRVLAIYAHGINGFKDWGGMRLIAEQFAGRGIAFLKFNFSHNGTTLDDPSAFSDLEAYGQDNYSIRQSDLKAVFNFIHAGGIPLDPQSIVLIGHSRGGVDSMIYAYEHDHIDALITWSAPHEANTPWSKWDADRLRDWKENGVTYLLNGRTKQEMPLYYQLFEDVASNSVRYDVVNQVARIEVPWLILHGDQDEAVAPKSAEILKGASKQPKLEWVKDTGHTFGRSHPWQENTLPTASFELCEQSIQFILKALTTSEA